MRKIAASFLCVGLWSSICFADTVAYYRALDGKVVASTTSQGRVDADHELAVLSVPGVSYVRFPSPIPDREGHDRYWRNNRIEYVEREDYRQNRERRNRVRQELRDRGFTPDMIREILDRD